MIIVVFYSFDVFGFLILLFVKGCSVYNFPMISIFFVILLCNGKSYSRVYILGFLSVRSITKVCRGGKLQITWLYWTHIYICCVWWIHHKKVLASLSHTLIITWALGEILILALEEILILALEEVLIL